jgi:uncharacterized protein (DUF488 family)
MVEVMTIGAYGWNADTFFDALVRKQVRTFYDLRRRRGVRGPEYAFVNSARLQERLRELGIAYEHRLELAPSRATRQQQYAEDERMGVGKRDRSQLGPAFKSAYAEECLDAFDSAGFLAEIGSDQPICLFCVERDPDACHRSLVAEKLASAGAAVRHLLP